MDCVAVCLLLCRCLSVLFVRSRCARACVCVLSHVCVCVCVCSAVKSAVCVLEGDGVRRALDQAPKCQTTLQPCSAH